MPRGPRKGVGGPGKFAQRTDLARPQKVQTPTGLQYGERARLEASQNLMPLRPAPEPAQMGAAAASASPDRSAAISLGAPTQRPSEPVTTRPPMAPVHLSELLDSLATDAPYGDLIALANEARTLGL